MTFRMDPPEPGEADPADNYPPTDEELELIAAGNDPRFVMDAADLPF